MVEYLTTSQVARRLSVSPDTVLKWVKAGRLESHRTLGGHYRIPDSAVESLVGQSSDMTVETKETVRRKTFQYCWEFHSDTAEKREACEQCIIYRSRASRCYELRDLPNDFGSLHLYCDTSCSECDYYRLIQKQDTNVLLVGSDLSLVSDWDQRDQYRCMHVEFAASEYEIGRIVEHFRPDSIVLDCSLGSKMVNSICQHLAEDARLPLSKIILASRTKKSRDFCRREIFCWIKKPFTLDQLEDCVGGADTRMVVAT